MIKNGKKPDFCDLVITESCMLKCKMCRMWQSNNDGSELDIEVWRRFIDNFSNFVSGKSQVQFVGGEPLIKKGVLDLIRHTSKKGFFTTMTSNGYLVNEDMAKDIAGSGLNTIVFSLDSIKKDTHDFLRGLDGVYDRIMNGIEILNKFKNDSLKIHIVTTIMQQNLDDLLGLAEWANGNEAVNGISFQAIMQPFFTPVDEDWQKKEEFSFLWPKAIDRVDHILDKLIEFKKAGWKITNPAAQFNIYKSYFRNPERFVKVSRCNLGYNSITINTAGKIFLCNSLAPIGDIKESPDISELWFSDKAEEVRENIRNCNRNCKLLINCFFEEEK
ncbi:MAG: radical SAM protein [Candidatus Omnitrophica bacterium]|nr:radical SAM protein [Candidatus Omnitrophota bacterium]MBU1928385.1 radical SAM protein [Candidatus Omnitrophota bacterium]